MLAASASLLNVDVVILDNGEDAPAKQIVASSSHVDGSFSNASKIRELAQKVDILTVEIEHVDVAVLEDIAKTSEVEIHPSPSTIRIIQDKFIQKEHLRSQGLAVADFVKIDSESSADSIKAAVKQFGLPLMLKSRTLAYDGRGNYVLKGVDDIPEAVAALGGKPLYAERFMPFLKEVAVMVVRSVDDEVQSYPVVETVHKDNVCHLVFAPLRHANPDVLGRARTLAEDAVRTFTGAGIFGVEMFLLEDGASKNYYCYTVAELGLQIPCSSTRLHLARIIPVTTQSKLAIHHSMRTTSAPSWAYRWDQRQ